MGCDLCPSQTKLQSPASFWLTVKAQSGGEGTRERGGGGGVNASDLALILE